MPKATSQLTMSGRYVAAVGALRQAHPHADTALTTLRDGYTEAMSDFRARHAEGLALYRELSPDHQRDFLAVVLATAVRRAKRTTSEGRES